MERRGIDYGGARGWRDIAYEYSEIRACRRYTWRIYIYIYMYIRRQLTPTEKKTQDGGRRLKAGGEKEDDIIDKGRVLPIASCLSLQRLRGVGRGEREHKR